MPTANELLARLANPTTESHIVIGADRYITVPEELKRIAVQHDHDIETVTFDCPRYWDGNDMSQMRVYINYRTPDNRYGSYPATHIVVDASDTNIMHFDWTISRDVTFAKGKLSFLVCIRKFDTDGNEVNHWNSELNQDMYISEGLECEVNISQSYPDILTDILARLDSIGTGSGDISRITSWSAVNIGSQVSITYTLENNQTYTDIITFNNSGYPISIDSDGLIATGTWEGF